jgi:tight adherence protein C
MGAAMVTLALAALWWAVSATNSGAAIARNLAAGVHFDFRRATLDRSARERAVAPALDRLAGAGRRLTPDGMVGSLERRILLAGASATWPIERVLAFKLLLGGVGALVGAFLYLSSSSTINLVIAVAAVALGYFGPDLLLQHQAEKRQRDIQLALPDTLDQVTISVEAGLAFDAALSRAAKAGAGPLAEEILRVMQDIQAGMSRNQALDALVNRTDVAELKQFVHAIGQADSFGIPIAQVLRVQAAELRLKRRQRAEERAMKLPVKVLFPLLLCIFPTMFAIILGPAVLRLVENLGTG